MYINCINKLNNKLLKCSLFTWRLCSNELRPHSCLYINGRYGSVVHHVLKPLIDYNCLQLIVANIDVIKRNYTKRGLSYNHINFDETVTQIRLLIDYKKQLEPIIKLRDKFLKKNKNKQISDELKLKFEELNNKVKTLNELTWNLEESVIPFVLNIPNDVRLDVNTNTDTVLDSFRSKPKSTLNLDYIRLAYINKCLYKSIIGPHSTYLVGTGAQLHLSLNQYFYDTLTQYNFNHISSIDFVKSAIIEACNSFDVKDYKNDGLTIDRGYDTSPHNQCTHLVGNSSLESICAFLSQIPVEWSTDSIRFIACGNHYLSSLEQKNIIQTLSITQSKSDNEMNFLCDTIWKCLLKLGISCRIVKCSAQQLKQNQYCRYQFEVLLHSSSQWITVSQIINYQNYLSLRLGLNDMHVIETKIDPYPMILSILEHNQNFDASIQIPECLKLYFIKE